MEKKSLILIIILVLTSLTAGLIINNIQDSNKIDFETISKGAYSNYKESANYIINSDRELENLEMKVPEIDFSQFSVIAVFMGEFNTGGYAIEIKETIEKENKIIIKVIKTFPEPGQPVTQALSQPYHIIKIKKINKGIVFEDEN